VKRSRSHTPFPLDVAGHRDQSSLRRALIGAAATLNPPLRALGHRPRAELARPWINALAALALIGASGCFEGGALDAAPPADTGALVDTVAPEDTSVTPDGVAPDDTSEPADTAPADTATVVGDSVGPPDTVTPVDTAEDTAVDTVEARPCLTVADCAGVVAPGDKCAGKIGCVDYQCVVDPATVVTCPDDGDPCTTATCDPATGECVTSDSCTCVPVGALACGTPVTYTTGDPGETDVLDGYTCGGAGASNTGPERVFTFSLPSAQRVRFTAAAAAGLGGVWVVPLGGGDCAPDGCLAGNAGGTVLLDVPGQTPLAVVVEHTFGGWPVTLTADCGVTVEDRCGDGLDDDGDGQTDCADPNCASDPACQVNPTTEISCTNAIDDDKDGKTDCADGDCAASPACFVATPEDCFDGADNDGDLLSDCADPDCAAEPSCLEPCVQINGLTTHCSFWQGAIGNGGGYSHMSHYYGCPGAPASPGKEVIYPFHAPGTGTVTVNIAWGGAVALTLYVLADEGQGCAGASCIATAPHTVTFTAVAGTDYFFVIDGASNGGVFDISVSCAW
jgi:hypothetical protein